MSNLIIKIRDVDRITAYKIVNHLSFKYDIQEAQLDNNNYVFSKDDKTKLPKHFLKEEFGNKSMLKKYE